MTLEAQRQALLERFHAREARAGDGEALRRLNEAIEREAAGLCSGVGSLVRVADPGVDPLFAPFVGTVVYVNGDFLDVAGPAGPAPFPVEWCEPRGVEAPGLCSQPPGTNAGTGGS